MVMVVGKCTGSKVGMRAEGLLIHEHILAWCLFCLGLSNRLCVAREHGMAWCRVVSCGIVNLRDEALCRYEIMSIRTKACEGNLPVGVLS